MSKKDVRKFVRGLYHLLDGNINLIESIEVLEYTFKGEIIKKIKKLKNSIKKGESLEKSFSIISKDEAFINLIKIGEETGDISIICKMLNEKYDFESSIEKEIIRLSIYPIVVINTATLIVFILLKFVVPKFVDVYKDMNQELPKLTKLIIGMSEITNKYYIHIIVVFIIIILCTYILIKKKIIKFDKYIFKVPIIGKINKKIFLLKFSQELYTLINSNVDFIKSLKIMMNTKNDYIRGEIKRITLKIEKGNGIENSFKESDIFDIEYRSYLKIAEKTGNLSYSFEQLKNIYYERVRENIQLFLKLLEPLSIIFIAIIIGVIVLSIMIPIFRLGENL